MYYDHTNVEIKIDKKLLEVKTELITYHLTMLMSIFSIELIQLIF